MLPPVETKTTVLRLEYCEKILELHEGKKKSHGSLRVLSRHVNNVIVDDIQKTQEPEFPDIETRYPAYTLQQLQQGYIT